MKIALWYDPVVPETGVQLDGNWVDGRDIYSFLYPVRGHLLQTWLQPGGSWSGLERQLLDLARGQEIKLEFHGRETDAQDLAAALAAMAGLDLSIRPWEPEELWASRLTQAEIELGRIAGQPAPQDHQPLKENPDETGVSVFPCLKAELELCRATGTPDPESWLDVLETPEDISDAARWDRTCCLVKEELLDSYDRLIQLRRLTRSMRRCPDMICCALGDQTQGAALAQYAAQVPGLGFRFGAGDGGEIEALRKKYGGACLLSFRRLGLLREVELLEKYMAQEDTLRERQSALKQKEKQGHARAEDLREQEQCRKKLNWIRRKAEAMAQLRTLLQGSVVEEVRAHE